MSTSLGKSLQRIKRANQQQKREIYRSLFDAERSAALEVDQLRQSGSGRLEKLKSIWQTNDLDNFLSIADAREEGYFAERNLRVVINGEAHLIKDDKIVPQGHADTNEYNWLELSAQLTIPKRPRWSYDMPATVIQDMEKKAFLDWRRSITATEAKYKILVTPYEKNLEVWRQLWRVVERADIVVMILDARNPLIFRCADFELYVRSMLNKLGHPKKVLMLLNKADLLTQSQRIVWAEYFKSQGDTFFFFSARLPSNTAVMADMKSQEPTTVDLSSEDYEKDRNDIMELVHEQMPPEEEDTAFKKNTKVRRSNKKALRRPIEVANAYELLEKRHTQNLGRHTHEKQPELPLTADEIFRNRRLKRPQSSKPWSVLSPVELLDQLALLRDESGIKDANTPLMVGLVGYPNVGKSSTINAIIGSKKVIVSATPGKTKHFQTLFIPNERRVALCDCPGLVFPSFASTKEQMVCDGILPVDTATDVLQATSVICRRIPRSVLESTLNISLDAQDDEEENVSLAERLLGVLARHRGYMASHDRLDRARAGKELLKRYVDGKLVYVEPPPTYTPDPTTLSVERYEKSLSVNGDRTVVLQSLSAKQAGVISPAEDCEDWNSEDERAWADFEEADDTHSLSQDENQCQSTKRQSFHEIPFFFERPPGLHTSFTRYEYFNLENNVCRSNAKKFERRRKKNTNHQLQEDSYTFVNTNGQVELRIDEDDGVLELVTPSNEPYNSSGKSKVKSKRQQRREAKKKGSQALISPFGRRMAIRDY